MREIERKKERERERERERVREREIDTPSEDLVLFYVLYLYSILEAKKH